MRRTFKCGHVGRFRRRLIPGCGLAGLVIVIAVAAQAQEPVLVVGNAMAVNDPLGRPFRGINGSPELSARVEIRATFGGGILSPTNEEARLDSLNPLMRVSYIGHDVPIADSGLFSETFASNELHSATSYYARVFDWTSRDTSIYYADTLPFAGMASGTINPEFGVLKLVSTGEEDVDTDGDGIPDAMEIDMGLDPNTADTDGDGYSDYFEVLYPDYLDPNDEGDPRLVLYIHPPVLMESDPYTVSWETIPVPGMEYILEYTDALPYEDLFTATVTNVIATDTNLVVPVDEWIQLDDIFKGFFRVTIPYSMP